MNGDSSFASRVFLSAGICGILVLAGAGAMCAPGAARGSIMTDGPPPDLIAATRSHYERYGVALADAQRGSIAGFYHHDGAVIVFNGVRRKQTRDELRRRYLTSWNPPAYFAWEGLVFDSLSTTEVLVTGGFLWQAAGQRDTSRFIYAALVVAIDSGMAITFEHETARPPR
jgi:hypothetical protein